MSADEAIRVASLVETGFFNWQTFHAKYHSEQRLHKPDPGQATWEDLEGFARQHAKAKPVEGFASLTFERHDKKEIVSSLEDILVLEFPDGSCAAFADISGRHVVPPPGKAVVPACLNVPILANTLRAVGFPDQPSGAAFLRWSESSPPPALVPKGVVGIVILARVTVSASSGTGWNEHATTLRVQLVPQAGESVEIGAPESGALVRGILSASIRSKPEASEELIRKMEQTEAALLREASTRLLALFAQKDRTCCVGVFLVGERSRREPATQTLRVR